MDFLQQAIPGIGLLHATAGQVVMWILGLVLIYLAIKKQYEPYLLLPIGFGVLLVNLPLAGMVEGEGLVEGRGGWGPDLEVRARGWSERTVGEGEGRVAGM